MFPRFAFYASLFAAAILASRPAVSFAAPKRPNIILFLVDDMGWRDCGAYGSQYYRTPNIDGLARRGMLFTDAYSANPLCSPTRASLMTGKYPARHGITTASGHQPPQPPGHVFMPASAPANKAIISPESKNYLDLSEYTIAEALRDAGYRTAHIGKWHLGLTREYWPERQGFDVAFHAHPDPGPPSYFSPYGVVAEGEPRGKQRVGTITDGPPGEYIMDRLADEATRFIGDNRDQPFLLHLWSYGVHGPWGHKEEYTRQFATLRDPTGLQANPIMGSMLRSVDECLGRIVARLEELGIADNTIILFTSDNGGNVHSNIPDPAKPNRAEQPQSEQLADWRKWAGNLPPTNNHPLRDGKGNTFEGGIRVPLIVVWPGVVQPGSRCGEPACAIDFYPTMLEMAGVERKAEHTIDGVSLAPALRQSGPIGRKALFNYMPHGGPAKPATATVRAGDWKLIRRFETSPQHPEQRLLFNLSKDLGETENLAEAMPEKVRELDALIDGFLKDTGALYPRPNPAYRPRVDSAAGVSEPSSADPSSADPLLGWKLRQCEGQVRAGALALSSTGRAPFLGIAGLKLAGPLKIRFRARGPAGEFKLQWRTEDQDDFPVSGQTHSFVSAGGKDWAETVAEVPAAGMVVHARFYLAATSEPIEIDWLEMSPLEGPVRRWDFR